VQAAAVGDRFDLVDELIDRAEYAADDHIRHANREQDHDGREHDHRPNEKLRRQLSHPRGHRQRQPGDVGDRDDGRADAVDDHE
jgi:hypothetical protein